MDIIDLKKEIKQIIKKCNIPDNEKITIRYYNNSDKIKYIITENKRIREYYLYDFSTGTKIGTNDEPVFKILEEKGFECYD
jgi:hypothetical protein